MLVPVIPGGTMQLVRLMDSQSPEPNAARGFEFMKSASWRIVNPDGAFATAPPSVGCGVDAEDFRAKRVKM